MKLTKVKLALLIGVPLLLALLGVLSYFAWKGIVALEEDNRKKVEEFGELVIPADIQPAEDDIDPKLRPTISSDMLSPSQKVINRLKDERVRMLEEAVIMREEIIDLKAKVAELEEYKRANERYAPHTFNEEVSTVHARMKQLLASQNEAKRFSSTQLKGMAAAAAKEYRRFLTMHKLVLEQQQIDTVVNDWLPSYAYCIGDGIDIAANTRSEELMIVEFFKTDKTDLMSNRLKSDLNTILEPCQQAFARRMAPLVK